MSKNKKKENEDKGFLEFVSSAIRAPRGGAYEHLLSQFLASSVVVTDPLKRIKIVTEAALMIPERERDDLAINYEKIQELNAVANAFLNRSTRKLEGLEIVSIPWGFYLSEENFERIIAPWLKCKYQFWTHLLTKHVEKWRVWQCRECGEFLAEKKLSYYEEPKFPSKCPKCKEKLDGWYDWKSYDELRVVENPVWSLFFEASGCLTLDGYNTLKNCFAAYAIPTVQAYLAELTRVVSPSLYSQIIGLYTRRGKQSYAEKVREIAEKPKDEGSLGPR